MADAITLPALFGMLALLHLVGYAWYALGIFRGCTRPNAASWFMWLVGVGAVRCDRRRGLGQRARGDHLGGQLHPDLEKHAAPRPRGAGSLVRLVRGLPGDARRGAERSRHAGARAERLSRLLLPAVRGGCGLVLCHSTRVFAPWPCLRPDKTPLSRDDPVASCRFCFVQGFVSATQQGVACFARSDFGHTQANGDSGRKWINDC